jgi:hypothetical protein
MTWSVIMDVPAPIEVYDALHAELLQRTGGTGDGLLVHLARATDSGFQVIEVWESREAAEWYERELIRPVMAELGGGPPLGEAAATEFEVHGLVIPAAAVAR